MPQILAWILLFFEVTVGLKLFKEGYIMRKKLGKESGFTLIEVVVVIAIIAILAGIAVPMWTKWLPSYRLKAATRNLVSTFQKAKMEAARRNATVAIAFDTDNDEYTLFVDDGEGGGIASDLQQTADERTLNKVSLPKSTSLDAVNFGEDAIPAAGFTSRGLPAAQPGGASFGNGTITLSNSKGLSRYIKISVTGNIRVDTTPE